MTSRTWKVTALSVFFSAAVSAAPMTLGMNFWAVPWAGPSGDPFKATCKNVTGDNPWKPGLLTECKPYHILRMMDWNHTNGHYLSDGYQAAPGFSVTSPKWADRKKKADKDQQLVAYEWQIDMCNRVDAHLWVCIPHKTETDSTYAFELATLIREQLKPTLKVYVEWSNETWNTFFPATAYSESRAGQMGFAGGGAAYHTYAAVKGWEQFEKVFGKDSPRVVKVLSGFMLSSDRSKKLIDALSDPKINPRKLKANGLALADYWRGPTDHVNNLKEHKAIAAKAGATVMLYEGGNESSDQSIGAYNAHKQWLAMLESVGVTDACYYMHSGGGGWECIPNLQIGVGYEKAMTYNKYRAIAEYCESVPKRFLPEDATYPTMVRPADSRAFYGNTVYRSDLLGRLVKADRSPGIEGKLLPRILTPAF